MRIKLLVLALLLFAGALFLFKPKTKPLASTTPITENKSFAIIIPSYNNAPYVEKNLRSVFSQAYENYRVIYIDDNSRDDTLSLAGNLIKELDTRGKATLVHNTKNLGSLANIYNAVHSCHDHEIIVILDGDDFFAHDRVLERLNKVYADENVWLTYGNYLDYPTFKQEPTICKPLPEKICKAAAFRKYDWVTSHLRTFYASLFKQIQLEDLFYRGRFYPMSGDLALMFPLLELSKNHIHYIDEVLYLYNRQNPISDHKVNLSFQAQCASHIRSRPKYLPLSSLPSPYTPSQNTADLVIFSEDRPLQLTALLESLNRYVTGLNRTSVLYTASTPAFQTAYIELKNLFPKVQFIPQSDNFKSLLSNIIFHTTPPKSDYILFATDTLIIKDLIDLSKGIDLLERTGSYGLFYSHHEGLIFSKTLQRHQPVPHLSPLRGLSSGETALAWQFSEGSDDWNSPNNLLLTLYRKETLKTPLKKLSYRNPSDLLYEWGLSAPENAVGLLYPNAKCAQINLSALSKAQLLEKFQEGLRIDITPLFQKKSPSHEIVADLTFANY